MTRNGNKHCHSEREAEESQVSTAKKKRSLTYVRDDKKPKHQHCHSEREAEESQVSTAKRDPSLRFGMTNMLDYVISNEREKSLKNIANVSTTKEEIPHYVSG